MPAQMAHPQMMPPALAQMQQMQRAAGMGQPPTNSLFSAAMVANQSQVPLGGQPDEFVFMPAPFAASSTTSPSAASQLFGASAPPVGTAAELLSLPAVGPSSSTPIASRPRRVLPPTAPVAPAVEISRPTTPPALIRAGAHRCAPLRTRITAAPANTPAMSVAPNTVPAGPLAAAAQDTPLARLAVAHGASSAAIGAMGALGGAANAAHAQMAASRAAAADFVAPTALLFALAAAASPSTAPPVAQMAAGSQPSMEADGVTAAAFMEPLALPSAPPAAAGSAIAAPTVPIVAPATPQAPPPGRRRSRILRTAAPTARQAARVSVSQGGADMATAVVHSLAAAVLPSQVAVAGPRSQLQAHDGANLLVDGGLIANAAARPGASGIRAPNLGLDKAGTSCPNAVDTVRVAVHAAHIAVEEAAAPAETAEASGLKTSQMTQAAATTLPSLIKAANGTG